MAKPNEKKPTPELEPIMPQPVENPLSLYDWLDAAASEVAENGNGFRYSREALGGFGRTVDAQGWSHAPAREWKARIEAWLRAPA